ncbi:MAG: hypothetical protein EOO42_23305 [Flavobacteriales bacterium]|nr:MAG: hypothetical protein EOO42_23305 [Flavobacteriales bacterium]
MKNTVPFPPCNIKIITNDSEINHNIQKPEDLKLLVLADPSWGVTDKFRNIRINFDGSEGIYGACEVAILENMGVPVKNIVNVSEPLKVGIQEFRFTTEWVMGINQYYKKSENIEPESIGHEIKIKPNQSIFRESKSKLALHGVEIPMSMFAHWMGLIYQQAKVQWPICLLININIDGNMDINLNSARTEILIDDKWREFETKIATLICKGIHQSVSPEYWQEFKNVTKANVRNGSNSIFLKALESI